jgi:hypothetical protein
MEPIPRNRSLLVVHALGAADYLLGSPDFAAPALAQTHGLAAADFTVGPLDFGYDPALAQNHRLEPRRQRTGRPPNIPTEAIRQTLIGQMTEWLRDEQSKTCRRLVADDSKVMNYARGLAERVGIRASDHEIKQQVVRPALRRLRK